MLSAITNIYNKKTKGPTLMEFFTATGKLKSFFLQLEMFDGAPRVTHRYDIQRHLQRLMGDHLISAGTDTPVSVNCLYHARMVLSVGRYFAYFARNARCTVTTDLLV
jgi:hypothetical protein